VISIFSFLCNENNSTGEEVMLDMDTAIQRTQSANSADPRKAGYGYFVGGSFVMDSVRVFLWFDTVPDLASNILDVEPVIHESTTEQFTTYQTQVAPLLENLDHAAMTEDLRRKVNAAVKEFITIEWWGSFNDLIAGDSEFAQTIREDFRESDDEPDNSPVMETEIDEFVDFVLTYGV
jgi:hypothetical protein